MKPGGQMDAHADLHDGIADVVNLLEVAHAAAARPARAADMAERTALAALLCDLELAVSELEQRVGQFYGGVDGGDDVADDACAVVTLARALCSDIESRGGRVGDASRRLAA
jgi:hypothetical protein